MWCAAEPGGGASTNRICPDSANQLDNNSLARIGRSRVVKKNTGCGHCASCAKVCSAPRRRAAQPLARPAFATLSPGADEGGSVGDHQSRRLAFAAHPHHCSTTRVWLLQRQDACICHFMASTTSVRLCDVRDLTGVFCLLAVGLVGEACGRGAERGPVNAPASPGFGRHRGKNVQGGHQAVPSCTCTYCVLWVGPFQDDLRISPSRAAGWGPRFLGRPQVSFSHEENGRNKRKWQTNTV